MRGLRIKMGSDLNLKDGCINALSFLENAGVLTQEQQEEIELSIMNLIDEGDLEDE